MTIHLPQDVEDSVLDKVWSRHFASVDDALAEAWWAFLKQQDAGPSFVVNDLRQRSAARESDASL